VARRDDPRSTITPESFAVAPELLGLPLAGPWRRLFAMLADLVPVAILANAGLFVFLAFAAAIGTWRTLASRRNRPSSALVRSIASLFVLVMVLRVGGVFGRRPSSRNDRDSPQRGDSIALAVQQALIASGIDVPGLDLAVAESPDPDRAADDAVVLSFARALVDGDSARVEELRPDAAKALSSERVRSLEGVVRNLRDRNSELVDELSKSDKPGGLTGWIAAVSDDLGIGFGWGALYFTTLLVLGRGQTPGKRMFGVRVIRLDAKPIGWWLAFERFGSYFASFSTGLLGFAQVFWDRNRQALHDKAVETVVVRVQRHDRIIADRLNAARR
jgi:RDD family